MVNNNDEYRLCDRSEMAREEKEEDVEGENAEAETSNRCLSNEVDNIGNDSALVHTNVESQDKQ